MFLQNYINTRTDKKREMSMPQSKNSMSWHISTALMLTSMPWQAYFGLV